MSRVGNYSGGLRLAPLYHLVELELRSDPAHSLQPMAEAWTDFQLTRCDAGDRTLGEHLHIDSFFPSPLFRELAPKQRRLASGRSQLDHPNTRKVQLHAPGLGERVNGGLRSAIDRPSGQREKGQSGRVWVLMCGRKPGIIRTCSFEYLELALYVLQIAALTKVQVVHDPRVVAEGIECRKLCK
jgi:hypothetical protein